MITSPILIELTLWHECIYFEVLIQAGNAIDCTLGVTFGLSTLSAAAVGGLVSNVSGVLFGGTLGSAAKAAGLPSSNLTAAQRSLPYVKRNRLFSQAVGVFLGCLLGLSNLIFIDHERSTSLKLKQKTEGHEFSFEVEVFSDPKMDATIFIVCGPDTDGLLAAITAVLTIRGCSIVDISVEKLPDGTIKDTFTVVDRESRKRLDEEDLVEVSKALLEASSKEGPLFLKAQINKLEGENSTLRDKLHSLEQHLLKRRLTVRTSVS